MFKNQTRQLMRLPAGFPAYLQSLAAMAAFVRASVADYDLKLFVNNLFQRAGVSGHDFEKEIATLFFSLVMRSAMRAIRLMWNWCRMRGAQSKRARAIATTELRFSRRFSRWRVLVLVLLSAAQRLMNRSTFGLKYILIGAANGWRLTPQTNKRNPAGFSDSLTATPTKFGLMKRILIYAL